MIAVLVTVACIFVGFGVLAVLAPLWERLPSCPPMYDYTDEILPEPEIRARRYQPHPDSEWIVEP